MSKFEDLHMTPIVRARGYCIAHAVAETLIPDRLNNIVDIGCNIGNVLKDVQRIMPNAKFTGIDRGDYRSKLAVEMDFYLDDAVHWVLNTDKTFDLTICAWILVHLGIEEGHPFWNKLSNLSRFLLTFENENQAKTNYKELFGRLRMTEIRHDEFEIVENIYHLRVFTK